MEEGREGGGGGEGPPGQIRPVSVTHVVWRVLYVQCVYYST